MHKCNLKGLQGDPKPRLAVGDLVKAGLELFKSSQIGWDGLRPGKLSRGVGVRSGSWAGRLHKCNLPARRYVAQMQPMGRTSRYLVTGQDLVWAW